jgi:citrate lyase beta subunit
MIETPLGVLAAREISAASPRLEALVHGTSDLTKELHALVTRDRLPLITLARLGDACRPGLWARDARRRPSRSVR